MNKVPPGTVWGGGGGGGGRGRGSEEEERDREQRGEGSGGGPRVTFRYQVSEILFNQQPA